MSKAYTGINIQYPISQMILSGEKSIETRKYPIPEHLKNKELLIIETPGKEGKFKARIVGKIVFGESFEYKNSRIFYSDSSNHCVTADSIWKWVNGIKKFGWPILEIKKFSNYKEAPKKKGIKFTKNIVL